MTRVLIDTANDGTCEYAHFDADGNLEALEWTDDIATILDNAHTQRMDGSGGYGASREWKRLADVTPALLRMWESEMGVPFGFLMTTEGMPELIKKIKDPDYKKLRTDK